MCHIFGGNFYMQNISSLRQTLPFHNTLMNFVSNVIFMNKNFATLIMAREFFPLKLSEILAKVLKKRKSQKLLNNQRNNFVKKGLTFSFSTLFRLIGFGHMLRIAAIQFRKQSGINIPVAAGGGREKPTHLLGSFLHQIVAVLQ